MSLTPGLKTRKSKKSSKPSSEHRLKANAIELAAMLYGQDIYCAFDIEDPRHPAPGYARFAPSGNVQHLDFHFPSIAHTGEAGLGIIAHEVAHAIYTKMPMPIAEPAEHMLCALLDEPRIEARMIREWKMTKPWLESCAREFILKTCADPCPISVAIIVGGRVYGGSLSATPKVNTLLERTAHLPTSAWDIIFEAVDARGKVSMMPYAKRLLAALKAAGLDELGYPKSDDPPPPSSEPSDEKGDDTTKPSDEEDGKGGKGDGDGESDGESGGEPDSDDDGDGESPMEEDDEAEGGGSAESEGEEEDDSDGSDGADDDTADAGLGGEDATDELGESDGDEPDGDQEGGLHGKTEDAGGGVGKDDDSIEDLLDDLSEEEVPEQWDEDEVDMRPTSLADIIDLLDPDTLHRPDIYRHQQPSPAAMALRAKVGMWLMKTSERARTLRLEAYPTSTKSRFDAMAAIGGKLTGEKLPHWKNSAIGAGQKAPNVVVVSDFSGSMGHVIHHCAEIGWALTWACVDSRCDRASSYWMGSSCVLDRPSADVAVPHASAGTEALHHLPEVESDDYLFIISDFVLVDAPAHKRLCDLLDNHENLHLLIIGHSMKEACDMFKHYSHSRADADRLIGIFQSRCIAFNQTSDLIENGPWREMGI